MLEKPDLSDEKLLSCLHDAYELAIARLSFLPLGADVNTAVYRAAGSDGRAYFVKLRRGDFDEVAVRMPAFLRAQGIAQVIAPIETAAGQPWALLEPFTVVLYPFVEGRDGYQVPLSERQWFDIGAALRRIHTAILPDTLGERIPHETYTAHWREMVRSFQAQVAAGAAYPDPVAQRTAALLKEQRAAVSQLVVRTGQLGVRLRAHSPEYVLCHGDFHPGNVLVGTRDAYIVDWDTLIFAPKERDLALIGGAGAGAWRSAREAELFYRGYGPTEVDPVALAYYRCERVVVDIAEFCKQLLLTDEGGEDREQSLRYLTSNFLPGNDIEVAMQTEIGD